VTAPVVTPGVALGDCSSPGTAIARSYSSEPRPSNPAQRSCEGGRVQIQVQADRHFGNRIMDPVRVTVLLAVDPSVVLDLQSLSRGTIAFNGQEFDLVSSLSLNAGQSPLDVQSRRLRDGRILTKIDMIVQSSVPASAAPYLVFRLDLRYALGNIRDAEGNATAAPDWRVLSTPVVGLTMSPTAAAGDSFMESELEPVDQVRPWPTFGLLVFGLFLVLLGPAIIAIKWINRLRPGRTVPPNETAWRVLNRTFADGKRYGFSPAHFRAIASEVRKYLNSSAATQSELRSRFGDDPQLNAILRVLGKCDAVLFAAQTLSHEEIVELIEDVEKVVPRP
ncbi:MAG: hypothetical protein IT342_08865, partial [Candidatus Melainabacteria bacterium]|nr:hypothetical protein [Candidatus Melainabacteria bacterium]